MKIYLVGGAVRDELLGIPSKEKDWVVVDSSHQEMTKNGFKRVGKNFPVYIHPETKEEYALARKEKKTGKGHKNFSFDVNPNVSLSEDLKRRDITINAIAKDSLGNFYDPFGGMKDLKNRKIRIVSNAFSEESMSPLPKIGILIWGSFFTFAIYSQLASPLYICFLVLP